MINNHMTAEDATQIVMTHFLDLIAQNYFLTEHQTVLLFVETALLLNLMKAVMITTQNQTWGAIPHAQVL